MYVLWRINNGFEGNFGHNIWSTGKKFRLHDENMSVYGVVNSNRRLFTDVILGKLHVYFYLNHPYIMES